MSTLHDLRLTLEEHAEGLQDTEHSARAAAVHQRVRVVRRRRTASVVVAAVVAVIAVATLAGTLSAPREIEPADRLLGVDVPDSIEVVGFPYAVDELRELSEAQRLRLDATGNDRAVVLAATGLGSGSATLYSGGNAVARVRADEPLADPVTIGDADAELTVRLDGAADTARAGVAVYEATGELASGVSNGTAVFRDEVAGNRLVDAGFLQSGESAVVLQAQGNLRDLRFALYCDTPEDVWVTVAIDGSEAFASGCGRDPGRDAGASSSSRVGWNGAGEHTVRAYLTRGALGPQIISPGDMPFGLGLYERATNEQEVFGERVDSQVEYAGRTWVLDEVVPGPTSVDTADGDVLLGLVTRGSGQRVSWIGALDRGSAGMSSNDGGTNSMLAGVLFAGDQYDVQVNGGDSRLVLYRPE